MLMFHEAAGGENYTRLQHRYQSYLDLSDHLVSGRAILLGQAKEPASEVELDGESMANRYDQRWTFYRVVFPVESTIASESRR